MTRKKKFVSEFQFYSFLILIGVVLVSVSMLVGEKVSKNTAQDTLNNSILFLENQCIDFNDVIRSDEIKSLVRLTEKAQNVSYNLSVGDYSHSDEFIKEITDIDRLEALFVLDENFNPDYQHFENGNGISDWESAVTNPAISEIIEHPSKIYSSRIEKNGKIYDICAVSRKDKKGLVFAVRCQDRDTLTSYQLALEDMLTGYEENSNGKLYITDGQTVIGSTEESDHRKTASDVACITALDGVEQRKKLTRIYADDKVYYGGHSSFQDYQLYAVYERNDVFAFCHSLMLVALATYCTLMVFVVFIHNSIRNRHLEEINGQFEIIRAVSKIYVTNILVNLKANRLEFLYGAGEFPKYNNRMTAKQAFETVFLHYISEEDREKYREFCDFSTLNSRLGGKEYIEFSYKNLRGEWLNDMIIPNDTFPNGDVKSFLLVTKSIDNQKRLELEYQQKLEIAVANEKRASRAKTDFLRQMSHDVRTPINVILGMMEIGDQNANNPEKLKYCRNKTREAANFLLELVNDILTINKLDSGNLEISKSPFSLSEVAGKIFSITKSQAQNKNISLENTGMNIIHDSVLGDSLYVQQIILNIVSNAIKYSDSGSSVKFSVDEISDNGSFGEYKFTCIDRGIGMSDEFQKKMFEPFAQESSETLYNHSGIGLGLSVVKKLTDKMGGRINVISRKNFGTKFEVFLPFEYDKSEHKATLCDTSVSRNLNGIKVLAAEDNELNLEIVEHFLKNAGAEYVTAENGKRAVEIFSASKPGEFDVILMDVMMPVMSGTDAARAIRSLNRPDAKSIPILAMTANLFDEDIAECLNAGMNGHIAKPISQNSLVAAVLKILKGGK